jgi:hypothetical protein
MMATQDVAFLLRWRMKIDDWKKSNFTSRLREKLNMRKRAIQWLHIPWIMILANSALYPVMAHATDKLENEQLLSRVSLSFSDVPLNTHRKEMKMSLLGLKHLTCSGNGGCYFIDAEHVRHVFEGKEERLSGKWLDPYYYFKKPINALGIGLLREKDEVVNQISLFLDGAPHICSIEHMRGLVGHPSYTIRTQCVWTLGTGEVHADFDHGGQLENVKFLLRRND